MKKPTLSEIRARRKQTDIIYESRAKFPHLLPGPSQMDKDNEYLLDLVKKMGEALEGAAWLSEKERWEARALLEEAKK